ncbi:MAG: BTAD domain-containing putative transcriptional regulator [Desulfotignum sp.]|nr:BTAD domain-containing putative transcriptional regulator [Desulfotignum sp.]
MIQSANLPYFSDALRRSRLFDFLDSQFHKPDFLITGQAAQGKTTLAASYLAEKKIPVVWIHLTDDDNDCEKLFDRIVESFCRMDTLSGNQDLPVTGSTILGAGQGPLRHVKILAALFDRLSAPAALVLDDLEQLNETSSGFDLVFRILTITNDHLKRFLLSRVIPEYNLAALKMSRQVCIIENQDLSFTLEETRQLFSTRPELEPSQITRLHEMTNGWVGGLTLVKESLNQADHLPDDIPRHLSEETFIYFSQEIYNRLPDDIKRFLMITAVLETIDIFTVQTLFDRQTALSILARLEKRNLFIQRVYDSNGQFQYRYHLLFRNFLSRQLVRTYSFEEIQKIHRQVARALWENRCHEAALKCYDIARDVDQMARIIRIKGPDYLIQGNLSSLEKWIHRLPEKLVETDPWLTFFSIIPHRIKGGRKNIERFEHAFSLFDRAGDLRGMILSSGFLIEAAVFVRKSSAAIETWIKKGESLLAGTGKTEQFPWARGLLLQKVGLGYIAGSGNFIKGISACKNAVLLARQINEHGLMFNTLITLALGYVQAGDFDNARKLLNQILQMDRKRQSPEYRVLKHLVDIDLYLKNQRFEKAESLLDRCEADIETFGLIFLYPAMVEEKALLFAYTGRFDDARQMADHLNDFSILEGNTFYQGISCRIQALTCYLQNDFLSALNHVNASLQEFDPAKKGDIHYFLVRQLAGIILLSSDRYEDALDHLLPAADYFEKTGSGLSGCETMIAAAISLWGLARKKEAIPFFEKGFSKSKKEGYLYLPLIKGEMLITALMAMAETDHFPRSFPEIDHAISMVKTCGTTGLEHTLMARLQAAGKKGQSDVAARLAPIYKRILPRLHIRTFGRFVLRTGSREIDARAFEGAKPLMLLKALVHHGGTDVPKEILINDLWPDALSESGEKNFKITLHRLRKVLEKDIQKVFGCCYLFQKSARISFDMEMVCIDARQFMDLGKTADQLVRKDRLEQALEMYDKALEIYKGDFFAEEPYLDWVERQRILYRSRYMEMLSAKAMIHENLDQTELAIETWLTVLDLDPCLESACRNLMILYADSGRFKKALNLYVSFTASLEKEMDARPDPRTVELFNSIRTQKNNQGPGGHQGP